MKLQFLGHACFLLDDGVHKVLTDPFLTGAGRPEWAEKVDPDVIFVTHGHGDHVGDAAAIARRTGAPVCCTADLADAVFVPAGVACVAGNLGGTVRLSFGCAKFFQALHGGGAAGCPACGFLFEMGGRKIYHAGDTALMTDMTLLADEDIDVALLPIGDFYTMGPADALRAVKLIRPRLTVPMHYNTFQAITQDPEAFAAACKEAGFAAKVLQPGEEMTLIGVTGTNGKTTTTNILRTLLTRTGHKVGLIGTINVMIGDQVRTSHNTTPDVVDLQKMLYEMVESHCDTCVMEVSSHALALDRVAGIEYDTAVLTNITQDHLDFHKTMENYREAKALLFTRLHEGVKPNKTAVFNSDDPSSALIMPRVKTKIMTYGKGKDNDVYPLTFHVAATHMELNLHTPVGEMDLKLHITGEFNVYNVMGSICAAIAEGLTREDIIRGLDDFAGVPGRFQLIHAGQPFTVVVDYAHTPDGLENVLKTARQITKGKLWVIFGAGGDRDRKKRPIMGQIALRLADLIIVTSDKTRKP